MLLQLDAALMSHLMGMSLVETLIPVIGFGLCALVVLQIGLWAAQTYLELSHNEEQFELSQALLRTQVEEASAKKSAPEEVTAEDCVDWKGYRNFRVVDTVRETELCTSVYLQPEDSKRIPGFLPGQHLTFKFQIPGDAKPVVRCYSLSDSPEKDYYRISVKAVPAPADRPSLVPGKVSNFVNSALMTGDTVQIKSPSGSFYLDEQVDAPIVLLAGGIGITPLLSMVEHLTAQESSRLIVLVYGARNGKDHAFKERIKALTELNSNFHVVNVYSNPLPEDKEGTDYHGTGFVTPELLNRVLPDNEYQFYVCGPPLFMESVYNGLIERRVPESRIRFEAFGPASIGKKGNESDAAEVDNQSIVSFSKMKRQASWNENVNSLLELAEGAGVEIDSGCRAGSCGTCEVQILKGNVTYPAGIHPECSPGHCLTCIARPDGPVELDV